MVAFVLALVFVAHKFNMEKSVLVLKIVAGFAQVYRDCRFDIMYCNENVLGFDLRWGCQVMSTSNSTYNIPYVG